MPTIRATVAACILAVAWAGAGAANLQISPVSITLKAGQSAASISLQNQGDSPLFGQVRAFAWSQKEGDDVLAETGDLVASPPIIEIAPRTAQTIRLILKSPAPSAAERTFRLLIDEVPRGDNPESGVDIRLRYSVPVFVAAAGEPAPALAWHVYREGPDWLLRVANTGTMHAQLGATRLRNAAGTEFEISKGLLGYVLPGQERKWKLPVASEAKLDTGVTVQSTVNAQPVSAAAATQ